MHIGIVVTGSPSSGGTYYYSIAVLNALRDYGQRHEYVVFYDSPQLPAMQYLLPRWTLHYYTKQDSTLAVKVARLFSTVGLTFLSPLARGRHQALLKYNLDLVICPSTTLSAWWCGLPFVVAIHDVWHRHKLLGTTRFSEPFRNVVWRRAARAARIVLVDSELGKNEVMEAYGIPPSKIRVLPTGPAPFIWEYNPIRWAEVHERYALPQYYVFYPGGFAPAKNQQGVIKAIAILNRTYKLAIHAVFAGPLGLYGEEMKNLARSEGVGHLVHFLGLVPDQDMPLLYKGALCLIMPSYIGPTNMPIWEAFAIGCPVISSNVGAMPEQIGDAGLLFDPSNAGQLADCILQIYYDEQLSSKLIEHGFVRIQPLRPEIRAQALLQVLEEAAT
jgi:glycosyltransferase involved in cell wall biosynthesis